MAAEESGAADRLMAFHVGGGRFAIPLRAVLGVQEPALLDAGGEAAVLYRGRRVRVFDARNAGWCGDAPGLTRGTASAIIVGIGGEAALALIVDRVEGIVAGLAVDPLPRLVEPFVRGTFLGVAQDAAGGRLVVDPGALGARAGKTAADRGRGEA